MIPLLLVALAAPVVTAAEPAAIPDLPTGLVLTGLDGQTVDFDKLRGRPVLVNLWASWCPPCLAELPDLKSVHTTWSPKGLQVVGLAIDDQPGKVRVRVAQHGISWPVAFDSSTRAQQLFATDELPTTLLYDAGGHGIWLHKGELKADDPELQRLLSGLGAELGLGPVGGEPPSSGAPPAEGAQP